LRILRHFQNISYFSFECNPKKHFVDWTDENWRPCVGTIECYLSRPQEKNIFLWYMYASSGLCIILTIFELGIFLKTGSQQTAFLARPKGARKSVQPNRRMQNRLQNRRRYFCVKKIQKIKILSDHEMESNQAEKSSCHLTLTPIGRILFEKSQRNDFFFLIPKKRPRFGFGHGLGR